MDVLVHDLAQKLEIHHHALLGVALALDDRPLDRCHDDAAMAVQLVAEGEAVRKGVAVVDLDFPRYKHGVERCRVHENVSEVYVNFSIKHGPN